FNEKELSRVMTLLRRLETKDPPFQVRPKTNERAHWVKPELVAQVRFTEWTADGKLRQPVYLGLRDDKKAKDVRREEPSGSKGSTGSPRSRGSGSRGSKGSRTKEPDASGGLVEQLQALEDARKDGALKLPEGDTLAVTNLHKVFWPKLKLTKGDLFRYYARVAPAILAVLADRPLVMKRFPNGIAA